MNTGFKFTAQDMKTMQKTIMGSSKIRNIEGMPGDEVLRLGQLMTLFGDPLYITKNLEDQYSYCILAKNESGKEFYLNVYSGPSGPAIGGQQNDDSKAAADELAELIAGAKASDYEYEGYYLDGPCVVRMGIRNGEPYCEEEELDESGEEFRRACEEIYGV